MNKRKLEELIRLVEDSDIQELAISGLVSSVRIVKGGAGPYGHATAILTTQHAEPAALAAQASVATAEPGEVEDADRDSGLVPVVSPMVGTFYVAPSPGAAPYVRQGDRVNKGQTVCIVEAMKLMNEIESEASGTIVRILVENAQPVEFGQAMFLIEPD